MTRSTLLFLLLAVGGCADYTIALENGDMSNPETPDDAVYLRIDVHPPPLVEGVPLLSQTFLVDFQSPDDLVLSEPVWIEGRVVGSDVTPWRGAELPATDVEVEATLTFRDPQSDIASFVRTADDGSFAVQVVPNPGYLLEVVPSSAELPFSTEHFPVDGPIWDLVVDVGAGAPIWGRVVNQSGVPIEGAAVHVIDERWVVGPTALTDADGLYVLRVPEDATYYVVCEGRSDGREPVLYSPATDVDASGAEVNVTYANLAPHTLGGRVVDAAGFARDDVTVRLTSTDLDSYDVGVAEHVVTVRPTNGNFDTRVLAGSYDLEILPDVGRSLSPLYVGSIRIEETLVDLGTLALHSMTSRSGRIVDPEGELVAGASVTFTEVGFGGRSWTVMADESGAFTAGVPDVDLSAVLTPPAARSDLPLTRRTIGNAGVSSLDLQFQEATLMAARVRYRPMGAADDETPTLSGAVVEIRSDSGTLLGIAVTDERGKFEIPVANP